MAILGGIILIIIFFFLIWVALMGKFEKIGIKITNKIEKTFGKKENEK